LQDGDIAEVQQLPANTQFSALPKRAFSFKAQTSKLSAAQLEVEELTDGQGDLQLLNPERIKQLVADSDSPETLVFNLAKLIPEASRTEFTANLDQALYAADVLGYATSSKGE